jgi:hypothetical protein
MWLFLLAVMLVLPAMALAQDGQEKGKKAKGEDAPLQDQSSTKEKAEKQAKDESPTPPPATASKPSMSTGTYAVRLRDLEDRVNRLKEQIFRSKARLSLLAETVLDRKIAGAKSTIIFRNEMGGSFRLVKATFLLDGAPIFNKSDEGGSLGEQGLINLFDGPVMPGDHTVSVVLHYRGHGYGIFSYLKGYSFKTRSSRTFTVNEGKALTLEVIGYEKGGITTPLEDRPDVRYKMSVADYDGDAAGKKGSKKDKGEAK